MTGRNALIDAARGAMRHAYAPYSQFAVGAAVELIDGTVFLGSNMENASYGLSLCAEAVAIASASTAGKMADICTIAVVGGGGDPIVPCGRCRQLIAEVQAVAGRPVAVHCSASSGQDVRSFMLDALLPHAFGPAALAPAHEPRHTSDPSTGNL
ncbi:cytidine deaminase [Sphingobium subterraneum]|uniref:Cytidine deaminase n=1 Tax=Sphingobium subterraneum TaxID=627688 RepID=A0A841IWB1_9SPHN|nr:cytidine deaminase [Sphingobium subterraneum]MBB6122644.1 cytidine deaminase [Sphingobium subterraneum]